MRTQLLAALKEADDYISGQELCEHFGVSRTAIWKAVKQLKEAGYVIEAVQNKGYKIVSTPDCLNTAELESIRKTKWAGREIFYFDTIDSTNFFAVHHNIVRPFDPCFLSSFLRDGFRYCKRCYERQHRSAIRCKIRFEHQSHKYPDTRR